MSSRVSISVSILDTNAQQNYRRNGYAMRDKRISSFVLGAMLAVLCTATMSAAPVLIGTFDITGNVTVTNVGAAGCPAGVACITWTDPTALNADKADISASGLTGVFTTPGFSGNLAANIFDLHNPPEIVDLTGFPNTLFMSFNNAGFTTTMLINFIAAGTSSTGNTLCGAAPAAGQTCTPTGSLFTLFNSGLGTSSATWSVSGITNDNQSKFTGVFTSQFSTPYQTVLGNLAATGFATNSYSATFILSPNLSPIPEPGPMTLTACGLGLVLFAALRRRFGRMRLAVQLPLASVWRSKWHSFG
jgi:hypothetical protein